ncbi:MAG: hypothetical protein JW793_07640 [Acidobacteria bacterium]|nr:hypothetical protein [Acidobacteriota bacterium]
MPSCTAPLKAFLEGGGLHVFLFSHKNLMGANHPDTLFGSNPASNAEAQNAYMKSASENGVRYHFWGHGHNHLRSLVSSPDGISRLQNIIPSSNSYKFYIPKKPFIDES